MPPALPAIRKSLLLLAALLMTVVLISLIAAPRPGPRQDLQVLRAVSWVADLSNQLERFHTDTDRYPTSAQGLAALLTAPPHSPAWRGPYIQTPPLDPWHRPYLYLQPGEFHKDSFDLISAGRDGQFGTDDDICNR